MNVFFFQHPLTSNSRYGAPGRYAFDVTGPALVRDGARFLGQSWSGCIYADGVAERTPSTNIDPHVLSDVLPAFLSFCRIDKPGDNNKNFVHHAGACTHVHEPRLLSEVVTAGDIILFGGFPRSDTFFVDFVMCVDSVAELPVHNGAIHLEPARHGEARPDFYSWWRQLQPLYGSQTWLSFLRTRTFLLNLADALPAKRASALHGSPALGKHHRSVCPRRFQIVGRRAQLPEVTTPEALRERFATGAGFNFTPILEGQMAELESSAAWAQEIRRRSGLFVLRSALERDVRQHKVTCLGADTGLLEEILEHATVLVHEPLIIASELVIREHAR